MVEIITYLEDYPFETIPDEGNVRKPARFFSLDIGQCLRVRVFHSKN